MMRQLRGWGLALAASVALVAAVTQIGSASDGRPTGQAPLARTIPHTDVMPSQARVARLATTWSGGAITAGTGEVVTVYVSASLPAEHGTAQTWADFIAGLAHGPELSTLTTYIATLDEISELCGDYALGCYSGNRMASTGEPWRNITAAEVVRHEYGHHVAGNRSNAPWTAIAWGPKNWASAASICRRAAEGSVYPGDEGDHYELNPGEAWAETYRIFDERRVGATGSGWQLVDSSFLPDEAALQAAERDVLQPWSTTTKAVFKHRFAAEGKRVWSIPIQTPLDGDLRAEITLPRGGTHTVSLIDATRKTTVADALWFGTSTKRIATTVCGQRTLVLRVTQRGAYGRVVVAVEKP